MQLMNFRLRLLKTDIYYSKHTDLFLSKCFRSNATKNWLQVNLSFLTKVKLPTAPQSELTHAPGCPPYECDLGNNMPLLYGTKPVWLLR